jgi:hypothetical protein
MVREHQDDLVGEGWGQGADKQRWGDTPVHRTLKRQVSAMVFDETCVATAATRSVSLLPLRRTSGAHAGWVEVETAYPQPASGLLLSSGSPLRVQARREDVTFPAAVGMKHCLRTGVLPRLCWRNRLQQRLLC